VTLSTNQHDSYANTNWSAQATNTKTQYVSVSGMYTGYYNWRSGGGLQSLQNNVRADASSSYFRELLLRGDTLTLHVGIGDTIQNSQDDNYQIVDLVTDVVYGWWIATISSGYAMHVSTRQAEDYNSYFGEMKVALPAWRRLATHARARYDEQLFSDQSQADRRSIMADANLTYQIGKVQFSLQYQFTYQELGSATLSHNIFARLSRQFSF
jgi:hypothetical protein